MRFPHSCQNFFYPTYAFAAAALTAAALGSSCGEEACGLFGELFRKLEVRAVPGIRVRTSSTQKMTKFRQELLRALLLQKRPQSSGLPVTDTAHFSRQAASMSHREQNEIFPPHKT